MPSNIKIDVFISHSGRDSEVAEALIELIRAATILPHDKIRCTSVDGYRLAGGALTDEKLNQEVRESVFFIGLLTPTSLRSTYVLFELGARWGAELNFVPLLASGATPADLSGPLSSRNALSCSSSGQLHQLLGELCETLGVVLQPPAAYDKHLRRLMVVAAPPQDPAAKNDIGQNANEPGSRTNATETPRTPSTDSAISLLEVIKQEADANQRGLVEIKKEITPGETYFFPKLQYSGSPSGMKSRLFRQGTKELIENGWLYPPEDNDSSGTRTYEWAVAEKAEVASSTFASTQPLRPVQIRKRLEEIKVAGESILSKWVAGDLSQREHYQRWEISLEQFAERNLSTAEYDKLHEWHALDASKAFELHLNAPERLRADEEAWNALRTLAAQLEVIDAVRIMISG